MMTGRSASDASARMLRARSKPSMRGISMSDSTTAGRSSLQPLERLQAVLGRQRHAVAFALQQALRDAAHRERIVDHQHQRNCGAAGAARRSAPRAPAAATLRGCAPALQPRAVSPYSVASATGL